VASCLVYSKSRQTGFAHLLVFSPNIFVNGRVTETAAAKPVRTVIYGRQTYPVPLQTPHIVFPDPLQLLHLWPLLRKSAPTVPLPLHLGQLIPPVPLHVLHVAKTSLPPRVAVGTQNLLVSLTLVPD
jgi:hypothetical protein